MATRSAANGRTTALFPDGMAGFARQRLIEAAGLGLIIAGIALAASLLSYTPSDPSLSHATSAPVRNLLAYPGAVIADLLLQTVGLGGAFIALMLAGWGWRLLRAGHLKLWWLRIALMPMMVLLAALAISVLPPPAGWPRPLDASLGGVVGQLFLGAMVRLAGKYGLGAQAVAAAAAAGAAALPIFALPGAPGEGRGLSRVPARGA